MMMMTKFMSSIGVLVSCWLAILHVPASDAFRVSTLQYPPCPRSRTGVHQPSRLPSPRLLPVEQCLYAKHQQDTTTTTKQAKIRSMASFLVTQMLEKVMLEATSDQSKLTEADAMSLLETLQTVSEAKKAQDEMSTTWQAAEDAVEETLTKDEEVSVAAPLSDASETVEKVTAAAATVVVDPKQVEKEASPTESIVKEAPNVVEASSTQSAPLTAPPKSISDPVASAQKEQFQRSLLAARLQNERVSKVEAIVEPVVATPIIADAAAMDSGATTLQPRFPEIISKEFGKPLEVAASDVPALRETSIPHRLTNETEDLSAGEIIALEDVTKATIQPIATLKSEIETALNPEESPTALVDEMSYEDANQDDSLLETDVTGTMESMIDDNDLAGEDGDSVDFSTLKCEDAPAALEQATVVDGKDSLELVTKAADTVVAASVDKEETKNDMLTDDQDMDEGKSADGLGSRIKSFWNQRRSEPMFPANDESATTTATTMTILGDDDTPSDEIAPTTTAADIQKARKQPKSPEEEARLAAKYGQIQDLGERAYTILKDLGMI